MARIEEMVVPFALLMIGVNLVMMFVSGLPSSSDGMNIYDFGLTPDKKNEISGNMARLEQDMNALGQSTQIGVSGSNTEKTQIDILGTIVAGIGLAVNSPSLIFNLINFLLMAVFGFVFWIDYFFTPLIALPFGSSLIWVAWLFEGTLLIIHLVGLTLLLLRVITSFKK